MLKNAYLLAKIGADAAENEQSFAEFFDKIPIHLPFCRRAVRAPGGLLRVPPGADRRYPDTCRHGHWRLV